MKKTTDKSLWPSPTFSYKKPPIISRKTYHRTQLFFNLFGILFRWNTDGDTNNSQQKRMKKNILFLVVFSIVFFMAQSVLGQDNDKSKIIDYLIKIGDLKPIDKKEIYLS